MKRRSLLQMNNPINFRRRLKYLYKDVQRCNRDIIKINKLLSEFKQDTGLNIEWDSYGYYLCELRDLLKLNIPSRILNRISKAAKKQNCVVDAKEFIATYKFKNPQHFYTSPYFPRYDWHQIPFKRTKRVLVTSKHIEEQHVYVINGKETIKSLIRSTPEFERIEEELRD